VAAALPCFPQFSFISNPKSHFSTKYFDKNI
jgi:hypothetical protein